MTTLTAPPAAIPPLRSSLRHWAPLAVVLTGTFMVVLDFFIVYVALPSITTSLHASSGSVEWISAGYVLASAALLIAGALATNLLAALRPELAGAASGALSTAQSVGTSLGIALVGIAFFGAVSRTGAPSSYATGLEHGLGVLIGLLLGMAALSRLLTTLEADR
jgi:MFS family permease